jgi:hypothetical protein
LPSAVQTEAKSQQENQIVIKASKAEATKSGDNSSVGKKEKETTESGEESESDNEEIIVTDLQPLPESDDVNLDDEFEKIVPFKFKKLSEESLDEVDHEIEEILQEAEPLGAEVKFETEVVKAEGANGKVFEVVKVEEDEIQEEKVVGKEAEVETAENVSEEVKAPQAVKVPEAAKVSEATKASETESKTATSESDSNILPPVEKEVKKAPTNKPKPLETNLDDVHADAHKLKENSEDKPPVPIQTYLWEDVKKSKEQVSGDNVCTFHLFHAAHLHIDPTSSLVDPCHLP